jgi:type I restriction enzyme S subunit
MMFYKETNFEETPIGKIPKDWKVVKLGNIITYVKGKKPKEVVEKYREGYLPYLSTEYLRENKATSFVNTSQDIILVDEGDLILLWDGSNAGEFFWGKQGILSSTMVKIKQKEQKYDQKFLFYVLKAKESYLKGQTKGTGIPHVDGAVLNTIIIPYLSFKEQQKIASILSTVDEAIQKTDEIIVQTERLRKGLMQELLTKGIGHKEFKDTEIGRISKEWEVVKVNKLFDLYKGTTPSTKIKEYWNGTIPFVTPTDITKINDSNEMYLKTTENYITEKGLKSKGLKLVPKDSLLFTSRATIGYLAINKTEVAINQGIISLIPKDANIDVTFFYYFLQKLKSLFENLAGGSTYKEISMSTFTNISVPLPSLSEQQKIAEILSTVDKKLELERNEKTKLERIKRGLMDLLLTGKIRVKVN